MGLWLGTLAFLLLEVFGYIGVEVILGKKYAQGVPGERGVKKRNTKLAQLLTGATVVCCWMMWVLVYIAQKYPLVNPVLH